MQQNYTIKNKKKCSLDVNFIPEIKTQSIEDSKVNNDISDKCIKLILSFSKNIELQKSALLDKSVEFVKS